MADYFYGCITVGGDLRAVDLPRFCGTLASAPFDVSEHIRNGFFEIDRDDARYGQFEEFEELCRELGLSYIRQSDGKYEFSPEIAFWKPGMSGPYRVITDHNGNMLVTMPTVRQIRDALVAHNIPEACFLADRAVVDLPELPPFRLVENEG